MAGPSIETADRPIVVANHKMNPGTRAEAIALYRQMAVELGGMDDDAPERVVAVPQPFLADAIDAFKGTGVKLAVQHIPHRKESTGAFTGDASPEMMESMDDSVEYTLVTHSERRAEYGETDEDARKSITRFARTRINPIVCIGELWDVREKGDAVAEEAVRGQVYNIFQNIRGEEGLTDEKLKQVIVAYEPRWAIGKEIGPTEEQIAGVHRVIRAELIAQLGEDIGGAIRILYGGGVNAKNAPGIAKQENVNGALVGGAALKPGFRKIVEAFNQ